MLGLILAFIFHTATSKAQESSSFAKLSKCASDVHKVPDAFNVTNITSAEKFNGPTFALNRVVTMEERTDHYDVHVMREKKGGFLQCDTYRVAKKDENGTPVTNFKLPDQIVKGSNGSKQEMPVAFKIESRANKSGAFALVDRQQVDYAFTADSQYTDCDNSIAATLESVTDGLKDKNSQGPERDSCYQWALQLSSSKNLGKVSRRKLSGLYTVLEKDPPDLKLSPASGSAPAQKAQ